MKKIIVPFLLCGVFVTASAQEILSPGLQAKYITRFPFKQFSGGVMVLRATLNNIPDTLNFILDTGSGGISLDSATAAYYQVNSYNSDTTITGMGSARKVRFAYKQQLHLPGLTISNLDFHINDYDVLSGVYGEKIDGIIGYSFFSKFIVQVNFDSAFINVYSPGEYKYPRGGTMLRPAFTTLPIQNLQVKDRRKINFNFYFDTGAGLCFLMSEAFAKDSTILHKKRKTYVTQAEGMGGRLHMQLTVVKMLQIGNYKFRNVPTYIYEDAYNVTSYPFVGGLLGNDLLRRFNLVINYPNREIHLLPNSHFLEPFDYAYTGMATYFVDGHIVVDDIIPGSPADKAGLKQDDILVGINNIFTNNIMQYKTILQAPKEKIKLFVRRNGTLMQLTIKPSSIL
ncbi:MAG TPA: aspartyl protease family protein [Ferruginibacter sp.]|nr:aspartyl protease family protein [Ferruginibacter sp.]HMP20685.1 aspartyl protease family protein [Ferruginibacter sp.]